VGMEIPMLQRILLLPWLERKGTEIITEVRYETISDVGMTVTGKDRKSRTLEADTILVALPLRPNQGFYEKLKSVADDVHMIGDCRQPGLIIDAIADGFVTGRAV
jgi:pyruvate/2-oxoglutarate dehydrogenase complex dihydrolipoamide dehydrogenase (E3) component